MRLWHKDLIDSLPRKQLLGQWRECCAIIKNIKEKGFDKLENDTRVDWKLYIDGSLYSLKESIMELAKIIKNR